MAFTASLAWRHLRTEPARAPLLALRLMPGPARRAVRGGAVLLGPLPRAYAQWDAGQREQALATVRSAARGASVRRLSRLLAFTLAIREPAAAQELVRLLPDGARRTACEHRLALAAGRAVADEEPGRSHGITLTRRARTGTEDTVNARGSMTSADKTGHLRVLHLVTNALPHTNAGYTQRTQRIAAAQRAVGVESHVLTRPGYPLTAGVADARSRVDVDGVPYHRLLPWRAPAGPGQETRTALRLAGPLVERLEPDVLHAASNHRNARLALALGRRYGLPVVYEVRGFLEDSWLSRDPSRSTEDAFYRAERSQETACMLAADLVVTLGEAMRADIAARGVAPERILVVPNAVDEGFLEPLPDAGALRRSLGIGARDFVVGTTTSCYGYEGLDTLLDAVAGLRSRGEAVHAVIVGDGPELGALREHARLQGLAGAAHFPGRVPAAQVRRYHALFDVFAVPRRDERVTRLVTPLKPVEAMASGLPVVASDLAALREIVEPGVTGELIPPGKTEAFTDHLAKLAYSQKLREAYGTAGRERVGTQRTWTAAAYRYLTAYEELVPRMS